jgi:MazG family protein
VDRPIDRLLAVMARLRDPQTGCPWDVRQSFATIAPYTIEEAYEVADAIQRDDLAGLKEELGDLLLQVVFHAQMAREAGHFEFDDVANAIAAKMVERHPHVFGGAAERTAETQTQSWEAQKAAQRAAKGQARTLDGVPLALPALLRAEKLQKRAARVGFDWPALGPVLAKIDEELGEVRRELRRKTRKKARLADEVGDLLFAVVNLARWMKVDSEDALRGTNAKFERRFRAIEDALARRGKTPAQSDLDEMDALWDEAKVAERGRAPRRRARPRRPRAKPTGSKRKTRR